jgi:hypothetical protein
LKFFIPFQNPVDLDEDDESDKKIQLYSFFSISKNKVIVENLYFFFSNSNKSLKI